METNGEAAREQKSNFFGQYEEKRNEKHVLTEVP